MERPERLLADRQRPLVGRFRRLVAAQEVVQRGEIVEVGRDLGMFRPERHLADRQRPPVERLRPLVTALVAVQLGEFVEQERRGGMDGAELSFPEFECFAVKRNRLLVPAGLEEILPLAVSRHQGLGLCLPAGGPQPQDGQDERNHARAEHRRPSS